MRYLHSAWAASFLALVTTSSTGCNRDDSQELRPPTIRGQVALEAFESCGELEQYIEDTAVRIMRNQLTSDYYFFPFLRGGVEDNAAPSAGAPAAYTKTNVQVAGVDEADFVKTNGTHIFVLSGTSLFITRSWPATELSILARLEVEGYARDMYLDETRDRIVVLSTVNAPYATVTASPDCLAYRCGGSWAPATKVTVIDTSTLASPRVTAEMYLPGWLQNSRRIGGSVRLVLGDSFMWPENMRWYPEYDEELYGDEEALREAREELADANEAILRARSLSEWLPEGSRRLEGGALVELGYDCRDFHSTNAPVWLGFTNIATINLDRLDLPPSSTAIVAQVDELYSSLENMVLTMRHWWWWPEPGAQDHTYLFAFDIRDPDEARFTASGGVAGHILDQFSMDEHEGYLRLATNIDTWVEDAENPDNVWGRVETTNRVSVLGAVDGQLRVVGQTAPIASGERLQSSRFLGDRGFVVTFLQIDPLFTLDLSDPADPTVVGELEVPGFSSYIHPLGEDHLLTIGIHVPPPDPNGQQPWMERRMKLSIFDVGDLANPRELFTELVGTAYGWSEALWEHKAFNFFPERGLLAIPFSDYRPGAGPEEYWGEFVSELRVFEVGATTGIVPKGALTMSDIYREYGDAEWTWRWSPWIQRSVMADEFVYAISDAGIRSAHVEALWQPLSTVLFESPGTTP